MLKKTAIVAAAAAGFLMIGSPAFATQGSWEEGGDTGQLGLLNVDDVANDNNVGVCDNQVNVLGVQVADALNGVGATVPILSGVSGAHSGEAPDTCVAEADN
ncbi:hypothetical protein GCM10017786_09610 [Amycolatopsis deserti]|uniref:Secreted protein n=1 Tax=Amycolatopsis deserti TaxID=185696 RepID=A0ABQ3IJD3_9PSEU|nr:hypothetical protein [Amycolatopsis deserti]GHE81312.1 hypothetical protein GCM10017786_09610 [Amycolatopsis deserti]